jgi:hypothetical protein
LRRAVVFPDNPDGRKALEAADRAHPGARVLVFGDSTPSAPNDEEQWPELPVEVGPASLDPESPNGEDEVGAERQALSGAAATITVEGQLHWADSAGGRHPLYDATVQVRDDDTIGSELVASGVTGPDGRYHFEVDNDHFESITAGRDTAIRMDLTRGTIRIDVVGNVTLGPGHETSFFGADANAGTILFRVGGELQLRENGTFLGTFIVPNDRAGLYAGSTLRGAIYGQTVDVRAAHIEGEPVAIWFFLPLISAP